MKQSVGKPVMIVTAVVLACVLGYFAFITFAPASMTGAVKNPYAGAHKSGMDPNGSAGPPTGGPSAEMYRQHGFGGQPKPPTR